MKVLKEKIAGLSIRWKIASYLAIFIAFVLIITWVFQAFLVNVFYEQVKKGELTDAGETLGANVESRDLSRIAHDCAVESAMSVMVYKLGEDAPKLIANADATGRTGLIFADADLMRQCEKAQENGGRYLSRFYGAIDIEEDDVSDFSTEEKKNMNEAARLTYFSIVTGESDASYLIVLSAARQPMRSTMSTLHSQLVWSAAVLLVGALIMVLFLHRNISAPLYSMSKAAKQLALGKYDVVFPRQGYRETQELADTLNYATHELSKLDSLQKELIANISHDLRTPLTMIKGYGEVMRDIPGENTPENIQVIIDETTRLSELVNDMMDLSSIQSGVKPMEQLPFDLTQTIEEIMHRYDTFVHHKGYKIQVNVNERVWVCADRRMILQVLYNLINNAVNYTGEDLSVTVCQSVSEGRVRVSISDTGEGIAPEQMTSIWDRYYKVDKVHRRAMIGTGIGLSIVKEILEAHDASYGVDSVVGQGSTFWFELPVVSDPAQTSLDEREENA